MRSNRPIFYFPCSYFYEWTSVSVLGWKAVCPLLQIFNPHLAKDLFKLGLWDEEMRVDIVVNKGSIREISRIPSEIRELYKTVWETSQKASHLPPFYCIVLNFDLL